MGVMYCCFHYDVIDIWILYKWWYFFCMSFIEDMYLSIYLCMYSWQTGSQKVHFFCPIQVSYTIGKVLTNAFRE